MQPFQLTAEAVRQPAMGWKPPLAGLMAALCVAWLACPVPPLHSFSLPGLFVAAVVYVLAAYLASAVVVWLGFGILRHRIRPEARDIALRTAAGAVWSAPLVLFLTGRSIWAAVAWSVLVASLTRLWSLYRQVYPGSAFAGLQHRDAQPRMTSAVCAAVCAEAAALAGLAARPVTAAALLGISVAIVTWRFSCARLTADQTLRPRPRPPLAIGLAVLLTAAGLTPYLKINWAFGNSSSRVAQLVNPARRTHPNREEAAAMASGGDYSGVILWPDVQPHTLLVPPLPRSEQSLSNRNHTDPLSIPFDGVYWYFQPPDRRPPPDSFVARGSPTAIGFRSADKEPLLMEAHQNFSRFIDSSCCSRIQMIIRNGDRYPGTVSLELVLLNSVLPGRPFQSLGKVDVTSMPRWEQKEGRAPAEETLSFDFPAAPAIQQFDEVTIRYHLHALRRDRGAKIAIISFVLVPRDL